MKKYIFDRNEFKWSEEFYKIIKNKFNLPDWVGENADALWDVLTGFLETPCEIVFQNFNRKENDYNEHNINLIINCFKDAEKEYPTKFKIIFE